MLSDRSNQAEAQAHLSADANTPMLPGFTCGLDATLRVIAGKWKPLILYFVAQRLANLGMNRWWSVGFFIPLLKWWVGYRSIACPAGYEEHRKMDRPGMFLAITYWLLVVASVIAFLAILAIFNGTLGTADLQRHLQEAAGGLQK